MKLKLTSQLKAFNKRNKSDAIQLKRQTYTQTKTHTILTNSKTFHRRNLSLSIMVYIIKNIDNAKKFWAESKATTERRQTNERCRLEGNKILM